MTPQPQLFQTQAEPPKLTARQQFVHDLIEAAEPNGMTADEIGAVLHELRDRHPRDQRCDYCTLDANGVLRSKALKPRIVFRRAAGRWRIRREGR